MANGGIIGPTNVTSRGKNTVTIKTSGSSTITTQSGTRIANVVVVGGGGGSGGGPGSAIYGVEAVVVEPAVLLFKKIYRYVDQQVIQ